MDKKLYRVNTLQSHLRVLKDVLNALAGFLPAALQSHLRVLKVVTGNGQVLGQVIMLQSHLRVLKAGVGSWFRGGSCRLQSHLRVLKVEIQQSDTYNDEAASIAPAGIERWCAPPRRHAGLPLQSHLRVLKVAMGELPEASVYPLQSHLRVLKDLTTTKEGPTGIKLQSHLRVLKGGRVRLKSWLLGLLQSHLRVLKGEYDGRGFFQVQQASIAPAGIERQGISAKMRSLGGGFNRTCGY